MGRSPTFVNKTTELSSTLFPLIIGYNTQMFTLLTLNRLSLGKCDGMSHRVGFTYINLPSQRYYEEWTNEVAEEKIHGCSKACFHSTYNETSKYVISNISILPLLSTNFHYSSR